MNVLDGAFLGHVLAGFIGGGFNFCLGHWMASRQLKRVLESVERQKRLELEALSTLQGMTADEYVQVKLRRNQ